MSDAAHERELLRAKMGQRDKQITDLRHQLERQSSEVGHVKEVQDQLYTIRRSGQQVRQVRYPGDAEIVGRVTAVAMSLTDDESNAHESKPA